MDYGDDVINLEWGGAQYINGGSGFDDLTITDTENSMLYTVTIDYYFHDSDDHIGISSDIENITIANELSRAIVKYRDDSRDSVSVWKNSDGSIGSSIYNNDTGTSNRQNFFGIDEFVADISNQYSHKRELIYLEGFSDFTESANGTATFTLSNDFMLDGINFIDFDRLYGRVGKDDHLIGESGARHNNFYYSGGMDMVDGKGEGNNYIGDRINFIVHDRALDITISENSSAGTGTVSGNIDTITYTEIEGLRLSQLSDNVQISANVSELFHYDALGGDDTITVNASNSNEIEIHGDDGDDVITGGSGDDSLHGGNGDDILMGGAGADFLAGDGGDDALTGGGGEDIFWVSLGHDRITDFDRDNDTLDFTGAQVQNLSELSFEESGNNVIISGHFSYFGNSDDTFEYSTLTLENVSSIVNDINDRSLFPQSTFDARAKAFAMTSINAGDAQFILYEPPLDEYNAIAGTVNSETLTGTAGNDIIWGKAGADNINAGDGNDIIILIGANGADFNYTNADLIISATALSSTNQELNLADYFNISAADLNTNAFTNDVVIGEVIDGGAGINDLIVFGLVDLSNTTLRNVSTVLANSPAQMNHFSLSQGYEISFSGNDRDIDFSADDTLQFTNDGDTLNRDQLWQALSQGNLDITFENGDINVAFGSADIVLSKADGSDGEGFANQFGSDNMVDSLTELDAFITLLNVEFA